MPSIPENKFELTRHCKRKRDNEKTDAQAEPEPPEKPASACFTNNAFSSTPKKLIGRRRRKLEVINENNQPTNPCLEVKSIADLVKEKQQQLIASSMQQQLTPSNPYEVVRKPPKKKKRETEIVEACFENPALNLELPEKQFNPYEVQRAPPPSLPKTKCFVNEALNLRGQEVPAARNPFEIQRCSTVSAAAANPTGVANQAMAEPEPTQLKIGLPFTPTVGCRIDFANLPISDLTPSKLLAEKLVFSPVPGPKRSLGSLGEETMDIGKELDLYQLELENSINEAKLRKNVGNTMTTTSQEFTLQVAVEQKICFTQRLTEITEQEEDENQEEEIVNTEESVETSVLVENSEPEADQSPINGPEHPEVLLEMKSIKSHDTPPKLEVRVNKWSTEDVQLLDTKNDDVVYASDSDEEDLHFKAPAPFVRAYQRAATPKLTVSKESLNSNKSADSLEHKKPLNVKNLIRNSIRRMMHHNTNEKHEKPVQEEQKFSNHNIMNTIRHSLRRKPAKQLLVEEPLSEAEISIIDCSERTMKFTSNLPQMEYVNLEQLTNEKKHTLRSSIRRMKSVFHKDQEEYNFRK